VATDGRPRHRSEQRVAARSCFDLHDLDWSDALLDLLHVPRACLPAIVDNAAIVGRTKGVPFLPDGIPVAGMAGDQQSALFGQACFRSAARSARTGPARSC
jgi:glycerol kinase